MGVPVPIIDAMRCVCGEWVSVPHIECVEAWAEAQEGAAKEVE